MPTAETIIDLKCAHCGDNSPNASIVIGNNIFCCNGCKFVYELLSENNLGSYYNIEQNPGIKVTDNSYENHFAYLDNEKILDKLLEFTNEKISKVTFCIPQIHCSSCIWLLENLSKLHKSIIVSRVQYLKKELTITFEHDKLSLRKLVELLASIGYEPQISLEDYEIKPKQKKKSSLIVRLAVAGFCFANIMLFSFPEYLSSDGNISLSFVKFFGYLNILLALPVLFFSASVYYRSAYLGLKQKTINMDVPISLGITVLFARSLYEILSSTGPGYLDSFTALVFFLLIGKLFQQKTYESLSFDKDYKSYFPISIIKLQNKLETIVPITELKQGDIILVRNNELIPADSKLLSDNASIDYSFVTGESEPIEKIADDKIYAGGKQLSGLIKLEVLKNVSHSHITQLWNNNSSTSPKKSLTNIATRFSKYFTISVISIAIFASIVWLFIDPTKALLVGTAVLIIACPCALALSTPITLGIAQRILGQQKLYFKDSDSIEKLSQINHIVFDKTGTLTKTDSSSIQFIGDKLTDYQSTYIRSLVRCSTHPLSVKLYNHLSNVETFDVTNLQEIAGKGISATINGDNIKIGSSFFCNNKNILEETEILDSKVHLAINDRHIGYFIISTQYRENIEKVASQLSKDFTVSILSGDNDSEKATLQKIFPQAESFLFNQSPQDKLAYIKSIQANNEHVLMLGDGLNDAGALMQADIGIALTEKMSSFSPASDGILAGEKFSDLYEFIKFSKKSVTIILVSFVISILYNIVGLSFAVMGLLSPLFAAVLMPISSLTVVSFVIIATNYKARKIRF